MSVRGQQDPPPLDTTRAAAVARRGRRPRGVAIALVGPDGAGKTTVARLLADRLSQPSTYVYMGVAKGSSSHLLPTTRVGARATRRLPRGRKRHPGAANASPGLLESTRRLVGSALDGSIAVVKLLNRVAEEWYRQAIVSIHRRRGRVVIMDRHFLVDFYMSDVVAPHSIRRRIHGWLLATLFPRPDLTLYLDAPGETLLARKGEGTVASLERMREEYRHAGAILPRFETIDASAPLERVVDEAVAHTEALIRAR